jgi:chromosome segregation ATPase
MNANQIAQALRDLNDEPEPSAILREKIARIYQDFEAILSQQSHKTAALQRTVSSLQGEKDATAARLLTVDTLDYTLDRVSEGELRTAVESLNSVIDGFVMNLVDLVVVKSVHAPMAQAASSYDSPLLATCSLIIPDDENREILMEAYLHRGIV